MKFAMGADTLSTLTKQTSTSHQDLGSLVRRLSAAADPVQEDFQGRAKEVFLDFKRNTDEIADGLNRALASVLEGVGGMDTAFVEGESQMVDETRTLMASVSFDSARFSSGGSAH